MILKMSELRGIKAGDISLAFRKWKKPTVRSGSRIKTAIGVIEITEMTEITPETITTKDALAAGIEDLASLVRKLDKVEEGRVYKIKLRYHSEDPRIALREQATLSEKEFLTLQKKLERLDAYGKEGKWTLRVLQAIRDNPELRAADLARKLGIERDPLKINIRKLKNLGLTISYEVGYSISPLGEHVLSRLESARK